jgi:hypothetical protein
MGERDGRTFGEYIKVEAQLIGRIMMARLTSFREAFENAGLTPSSEDFGEIWSVIGRTYGDCGSTRAR